MPTIGWINCGSRRSGGYVYGERVRNALKEYASVEIEDLALQPFWRMHMKPLALLTGLAKAHTVRKDLWIRDDILAGVFPLHSDAKNVYLIHHIDHSVHKALERFIHHGVEHTFYRHARKADAIVTVSEYWRRHFLDRGFRQVHKISPSFDMSHFTVTDEEVAEFRARFKLPDRPIVYIGNCHPSKGVVEAFNALSGLDVTLVTSGERRADIPALNLDVDYRDYLRLLKAADVAVTLSRFQEGWCMTAHEAMLLRTPVIGSGRGGMHELLTGGGQLICHSEGELRTTVIRLLSCPAECERRGQTGEQYARQFDIAKFEASWLNLIRSLLD